MGKIFLTITGTVVVLNLASLLIPDGKYEKYVHFVAGLIILLTVAGSVFQLQIDHSTLYFDQDAFVIENPTLQNEVKTQLIEQTLKEKLLQELGVEPALTVYFTGENIQKIEVADCGEKNTQVVETILQYCDINRSDIMIK